MTDTLDAIHRAIAKQNLAEERRLYRRRDKLEMALYRVNFELRLIESTHEDQADFERAKAAAAKNASAS